MTMIYHSCGALKSLALCGRRAMSATATLARTVAEPLEGRGLLRVSGEEAKTFLQGLITNDMSHLNTNSSVMYAMFLNTRGRVMYDAILYRTETPNTVYIECDKDAATALEKHLKMYRLRKKINIEKVSDLKVWAIFEPGFRDESNSLVFNIKEGLVGGIVPCDKLATTKAERKETLNIGSLALQNHVVMYPDPRLTHLGMRVLCHPTEDVKKLLNLEEVPQESSYCSHRYTLGVGEGMNDLPPDNCFPLEGNCDYLHGVSFHKGCYIGQELTARTHHTGVVRKRLMPLIFDEDVNGTNLAGMQVNDENGKAVGKVRAVSGKRGLGLLRVSEALAAHSLSVNRTVVRTTRPSWWPLQAPKEIESREKQ